MSFSRSFHYRAAGRLLGEASGIYDRAGYNPDGVALAEAENRLALAQVHAQLATASYEVEQQAGYADRRAEEREEAEEALEAEAGELRALQQEELARHGAAGTGSESGGTPACKECGQDWPCETWRRASLHGYLTAPDYEID